MSDLGNFQGAWLGKWHGGVGDLPAGFVAGNASFSINAIGSLTAVNAETGSAGDYYDSSPLTHEKWKRLSAEWDARHGKNVPIEAVNSPIEAVEPVALDELVSRLDAPLLSLADLLADAKLLRLEQAQALESAMIVRDVMKMAELAYLAELAVMQEKEALLAFIMFMD
jgi:hypothetical protein